MLTIGGKDLLKRYHYPDNVTDVYLGIYHIWPDRSDDESFDPYYFFGIMLGGNTANEGVADSEYLESGPLDLGSSAEGTTLKLSVRSRYYTSVNEFEWVNFLHDGPSEVNDDWWYVEPGAGESFSITVKENTTVEERIAILHLTQEETGYVFTVNIVQAGAESDATMVYLFARLDVRDNSNVGEATDTVPVYGGYSNLFIGFADSMENVGTGTAVYDAALFKDYMDITADNNNVIAGNVTVEDNSPASVLCCVYQWPANDSSSQQSCTFTIDVTNDYISTSTDTYFIANSPIIWTVYQEAGSGGNDDDSGDDDDDTTEDPTITGYGEWVVTISADPTTVAAAGGSSTITASASRTVNWSDGDTTTESATPTLTHSGSGSLSDNTVTFEENTSTDSRTATVTATYSSVSDSVTITQEGVSDDDEGETTYGEWVVNLSADTYNLVHDGTDVSISGTCSRTVTAADGTTTTEYSSNPITLSGSATSYVGSINSISADGSDHVGVMIYGTYYIEDTLTVTGTCEGKTDSVTINYWAPSGSFSDINGYDTSNSAELYFKHGDSTEYVTSASANKGSATVSNGTVTWSGDINISGAYSKSITITGSSSVGSYGWRFDQNALDWNSDAVNSAQVAKEGGTATFSSINWYYTNGSGTKIYGTYTGTISVAIGTTSKSTVTSSQSGDSFTWTIPENTTGASIDHQGNIHFDDIDMYIYFAVAQAG